MNKKIVLITGASRGIGASILDKYLLSGETIVLGTSTKQEGVNLITKKIEASGQEGCGLLLDVSSRDSIDFVMGEVNKLYKQGIDILINNAGITKDNLLIRMSDDDWLDVINVNLNSIYFMCKKAIRPMLKKRWGRIINIGSVSGIMGNAGQTNYASAKAGIAGFSKSLAKEVASRGITVNTIAPGFVDTDMTSKISGSNREDLLKFIPMNRFAKAEEIAATVLFLSSNSAAYITGEIINVNGGMYM